MTDIDLFVGLFADDNGVSDEVDTTRFAFVDGSLEGRDFFLIAGILPWSFNQPNNITGSDNCVLYFIYLSI